MYKYIHSRESAKAIVDLLSTFHKPVSVLDIGCGNAAMLKSYLEKGSILLHGLDKHLGLTIPVSISYYQYDLEQFGYESLPYVIANSHYDLIISLETFEHLTLSACKTILDFMCNHSENILFSAAVPNQHGFKHINNQPLSYWVDEFLLRTFKHYDIRGLFWNCDNIATWYRQNIAFFSSNWNHDFKHIENAYPVIDIIHPKVYDNAVNDSIHKRIWKWLKLKVS